MRLRSCRIAPWPCAPAAALVIVAIFACASPSTPASAPSDAAGAEGGLEPSPLSAQRSFEARLRDSIDAERAREGLPALRWAACVQGPAERWAARLAAGETLRHQSLTPILRVCRARRAGEIVGSTTRSPESLTRSWMASSTHRRTLLRPSYSHVGIGVVQAPSGRWFAVVGFLAF